MLPAKKKDFTSRKNISRICTKNPPEITIKSIQKVINDQLDIKRRQFTEEELETVLKKFNTEKLQALTKYPLKFRIPFSSSISRKFLGKMKTAFEGITPQPLRFRQSIGSLKEYSQRILRQHYSFLQGILYYTEMKDGENTTCILSLQRNCYHSYHALRNHEGNSWWKHWRLWHSHSSLIRRYISTIFVYALPRTHTLNVNRSNKEKWFHIKKKTQRMS